jgi:hypothetical protein
MSDYTFMQTGASSIDDNVLSTSEELYVKARIMTFTRRALITAATFVTHHGRSIVTANDIQKALKCEVMMYRLRDGDESERLHREHITFLIAQVRDSDVECTWDELIEEIGSDNVSEVQIAGYDCSCAVCVCMREANSFWSKWVPQDTFEISLQKHIELIDVV